MMLLTLFGKFKVGTVTLSEESREMRTVKKPHF